MRQAHGGLKKDVWYDVNKQGASGAWQERGMFWLMTKP